MVLSSFRPLIPRSDKMERIHKGVVFVHWKSPFGWFSRNQKERPPYGGSTIKTMPAQKSAEDGLAPTTRFHFVRCGRVSKSSVAKKAGGISGLGWGWLGGRAGAVGGGGLAGGLGGFRGLVGVVGVGGGGGW